MWLDYKIAETHHPGKLQTACPVLPATNMKDVHTLLKIFYKCLDSLRAFELSDMPGICINSSNIVGYLGSKVLNVEALTCQVSREMGPKPGNSRPVSFIFLRATWQVCQGVYYN